MKKLILFFLIFYLIPVNGGVNCLSNNKDLQEEFDTKEWHTPACNCNCEKEIIRGNKCMQCRHLQNPRPLKVITGQTMPTSLSQEPLLTPQQALEVLVQTYRQTR